ncbi:AI-2E family transporter [Halomarina oriensis]|uniref:AI-2E family transporter n=1 Tax=Halomarina oriensis TaxID=671145 RepID=A0A6B0GNS2_9EURY|nr:AI-2E family transporter [Halomarina oriensis]MWG36330.1 AI-2E family transporter [Halomarina oriensis]
MSRRVRFTQSTVFLWALLLVFGGVTALLFLPFSQYVLLAGLLGYVLFPFSRRLAALVGRTLGAGITVVLALVSVVAPFAFVFVVALAQAQSLVSGLTRSSVVDTSDAVLDRLGVEMGTMELVDLLTEAVQTGSQGLLGNVYTLVGQTTHLLIGTVVFLFVFYYLLRDGDRLVAWVRDVTPLSRAETDDLIERFDRLLWASLVGTVVVAAVQAVLTGIAFNLLGFTNAVFWTLVTFLLSLLPVIGASVVWIPASAYLLFVGRIADAVVLLVVGTFVISGSDNVIRPFVVHRGAQLNTGLVVVGIFGGLALFGFLGLFVGPVVVGLAKHLVEVLADRHGVNGDEA